MSRVVRALSLAAALVASSPCSVLRAEPVATAASGSAPSARSFAGKLPEVDGFSYVAEVTPSLYRGSQPDARGVAWLKLRGVKTVINLRHYHGRTEQARVEAAGMRYVHIPMATSEPPRVEQIRAFMQLVRDPDAGPLFVHCAQGVDRTGTMLAIYRMEVDGWSNAQAFEEMKAFGAHRIWRDLRNFVRSYRRAP